MKTSRYIICVLALLATSFVEARACDGCGCRGGPGYRGSDGRCVGWKDLAKKCDSPPTSRCSAEGPNVANGENDKSKSDK